MQTSYICNNVIHEKNNKETIHRALQMNRHIKRKVRSELNKRMFHQHDRKLDLYPIIS